MRETGQHTDAELSGKIKTGSRDACQELFLRYAPRIYRFSLTYLKNEADAEELVQDVFLKIWEKRERLDLTRNVRAFIFKVAVNTLYDFIRRKNIERAFADYARLNYTREENATWHILIFEEMKQNLDELISKMPEQQRMVFTLNRFDGMTNDEIALEMKLSKRTVENHLYRAVSFLKLNFKTDTLPALLFYYLFFG